MDPARHLSGYMSFSNGLVSSIFGEIISYPDLNIVNIIDNN